MRRFLTLLFLLLSLAAAGAAAQAEGIPTVEITAPSLGDWQSKADERPAQLTFTRDGQSFSAPVTIKPQGTSSLKYDKKNFTIRFESKVDLGWGRHRKYVLKANFIDPTASCNLVSAALAAEVYASSGLFGQTPHHGTVDGFPVWLIFNGEDVGLYTLNIPKCDWFLGMKEENDGNLLFSGIDWTAATLFYDTAFTEEVDWELEVGVDSDESMARFARLQSFVASATVEDFREHAEEYLSLDACIDTYCFICAAYGVDNFGKNLLMATWDGTVWYPIVYDLDSLWGIGWKGTEVCLQEGHEFVLSCGNLFDLVRQAFPGRVQARWKELRSGILSEEHIRESFERFCAGIPAELYERDAALWHADCDHIRTVSLMLDNMAKYLPEIDGIFETIAEEPEEAH